MAKQRASSQKSGSSSKGQSTAPPKAPPPSPSAKSSSAASRSAAAKPKSQGISPVTIGLVAAVVLAIAAFAIFYNQQRTATATTPPVPQGVAPVSLSEKGIPQGVTPEGYPFKGNPDAKVVVQDFSDYQCPHCGTFALSTEPKIEEEFIKTGRIKYVFRDFQFLDRLAQGQSNPNGESHRAAVAAHCALAQGKFWEMHDLLFQNQPKQANKGGFSDSVLESYAATLGLNIDTFRSCMKNQAGEVNKLIDRSMNDSVGKQVQGTPTIFVGDRKIESGDFETIKAAIELAEKTQ